MAELKAIFGSSISALAGIRLQNYSATKAAWIDETICRDQGSLLLCPCLGESAITEIFTP
jgi:hypothetical protein